MPSWVDLAILFESHLCRVLIIDSMSENRKLFAFAAAINVTCTIVNSFFEVTENLMGMSLQ
jgi:hypothetical protein